eukprot:5121590-Pleurochrysis_carterae.AAC.5
MAFLALWLLRQAGGELGCGAFAPPHFPRAGAAARHIAARSPYRTAPFPRHIARLSVRIVIVSRPWRFTTHATALPWACAKSESRRGGLEYHAGKFN